MNPKLKSRLENFKFGQATQYLDNESEYTKEWVQSLSIMFGNIGWFDGELSIIITHAINNIMK